MAKPEVPDEGYAWVIAFCACIINLILSGMARMIGILYVAIIEFYNVSRKEASIPFIVRNAIRYLSGPIVGVLGQTYGIRNVTFWGGLIAAVGSILCCIAPNVTWIIVLWGGIHGLGFSLGNTLFQVVVNQYFERHRATASGIVLSGACIGSFVFPVMLESTLYEYGLFGCFLLLGGLFLNVMPPSLLLKDPPWVAYPEEYARQRAKYLGLPMPPELRNYEMESQNVNSKEDDKKFSKVIRTSINSYDIQQLDLYGFCKRPQRRKCPEFGFKHSGKLTLNIPAKIEERVDIICTLYSYKESPSQKKSNGIQNGVTKCKEVVSSVYQIPDGSSPTAERKTETATNNVISNLKKNNYDKSKSRSVLENIKESAILFTNPIYILISISVATYFWAFLPVLTVIVDYTRDKGIPEAYETYLIHSLTVGDLIGRLCFGWVTDRKFISLPIFMTLLYGLEGVIIALFPFATSLYLYMIAIITYGITAGSIFAHFPVLVHKYVQEENQSVAMGCAGLLCGCVTLGIPPLIGHFRDNVGSYDGLFYIISVLLIASGCLWLLVPFCQKVYHDTNARPNEEK